MIWMRLELAQKFFPLALIPCLCCCCPWALLILQIIWLVSSEVLIWWEQLMVPFWLELIYPQLLILPMKLFSPLAKLVLFPLLQLVLFQREWTLQALSLWGLFWVQTSAQPLIEVL